jgi:hypothetical protein
MQIIRNTEPDPRPSARPQTPAGVMRFAVLITVIGIAVIIVALVR